MSSKLIIGIDIRDLRIAKTGTKTYLQEICTSFRKLENEHYTFYFFDTLIPVYKGENKLLKITEHLRYQLWKQIILPIKARLKGCDILFCTDNFVPYLQLGFKPIPVFHDAFFFEEPEHYNFLWLWLYRMTAIPAARRAPAIVTPTQYAKERIVHFTSFNPNKLIPVYEGPKTFPTNNKNYTTKLIESLGLSDKKYLLHVGVMSKRKNIPALIRAFKLLKNQGYDDIKLVLAGSPDQKQHSNDFKSIHQTIQNYELENEVVFTGYLDDEALSMVYKSALIYVFPSRNEGFGIPVLEAFEHRVPVLVANNTCLPEVGGEAVISFNPFSEQDMYEKIKLLIDEPQTQQVLISKGTERLKQFSWDKTAHQLLRIFEQIKQNPQSFL